MTTDRQIAANRQNAQRSTGPRTPEGKAASSRNNTRHGLRAATPVIPRLESPEDWEQHRATTVDTLAPETPLEETLAERVALILWRLNRVSRYERDVTTQSRTSAAADLANDPTPDRAAETVARRDDADHDLLAARKRYNEARRAAHVLTSLDDDGPGDAHVSGRNAASALAAIQDQLPNFEVQTFFVPDIVPDDLEYAAVPNWTLDRLHRFIFAIASANNLTCTQLHGDALAEARRQVNAGRITCRRITRQLRDLRDQRILPEAPSLDRIVRYETHLMRQLTQTLTHLRQLQQQRRSSRRDSDPDDDYHKAHDYYDGVIAGFRAASLDNALSTDPDPPSLDPSTDVATTDRLPLPRASSADAAAIGLPLARARERGAGGEGFPGHSNPSDAPATPGSPLTVVGAAPSSAMPAPPCATSDPECATSEPR